MDMKDHDKVCQAYWDIRARVQDDAEYARMREMLRDLEPQYAAALKKLPVKDRELVERYILLRESMSSRMLEWACEQILFSE